MRGTSKHSPIGGRTKVVIWFLGVAFSFFFTWLFETYLDLSWAKPATTEQHGVNAKHAEALFWSTVKGLCFVTLPTMPCNKFVTGICFARYARKKEDQEIRENGTASKQHGLSHLGQFSWPCKSCSLPKTAPSQVEKNFSVMSPNLAIFLPDNYTPGEVCSCKGGYAGPNETVRRSMYDTKMTGHDEGKRGLGMTPPPTGCRKVLSFNPNNPQLCSLPDMAMVLVFIAVICPLAAAPLWVPVADVYIMYKGGHAMNDAYSTFIAGQVATISFGWLALAGFGFFVQWHLESKMDKDSGYKPCTEAITIPIVIPIVNMRFDLWQMAWGAVGVAPVRSAKASRMALDGRDIELPEKGK
jgi:hypothetical protein